jgi:thioredoxin 2
MDTLIVACPNCGGLNRLPVKESYKKAVCGRCGGDLLQNRPIEVNSVEQFETIVNGVSVPVIVDFWAEWCGPCKMYAPIFKSVAQRFPVKANFLKVNTDQLPEIAARYQIRSIPTTIAFKEGREIDRIMGAVPDLQLAMWVDRIIEG